MKIYEIGTGYTPIPARIGAATEIVVEELTKAFLKQGVDVEIIDISSEDRKENNLPIRVVKVPKFFSRTDVQLGIMHKLKRVVYSVALAFELKKILRDVDEEIILHFHNQYNMFFFLKLVPKKLKRKCKTAYTNHSHVWHGEWDEISETIRKRYFQEVYCMQHADCTCVLNNITLNHVMHHIGVKSEKVFLIDNAVNTDIYYRLDHSVKESLLKKQGLDGKIVFIQVGSICDRKNQIESIRLLLPFMLKNKNVVFCYAGGIISKEYKNRLEKFAEEKMITDQVIYFGELRPGEELNDFYNMASAMIFPSKAEGFSLVILEAMASGTPVVIKHNLQFPLAENCLRFANENSFEEIICSQILCEENYDRISEETSHVIEKSYSWHSVAGKYLQIWKEEENW